MLKKYAEWLWANVIFALFPTFVDISFHAWRGPRTIEVLTSSDNIPALAFAVGILTITASSDIGTALLKLRRDREQANFTHYRNGLNAGSIVAILIFGAYEGLHVWLPSELEHGAHGLTWFMIAFTLIFGALGCNWEWSALKILGQGEY